MNKIQSQIRDGTSVGVVVVLFFLRSQWVTIRGGLVEQNPTTIRDGTSAGVVVVHLICFYDRNAGRMLFRIIILIDHLDHLIV